MGLLYKDELLDAFGAWALAYIPYGGPDFGEIAAVAKAVGDGGGEAFHAGWVAAGDRAAKQAGEALQARRRKSARELFLKASAFYASSLPPLFGAPVDPRLIAAFRKQIDALRSGLAPFGTAGPAAGDPVRRRRHAGLFPAGAGTRGGTAARPSSSPTAMTPPSPTCFSPPRSPPAGAAIMQILFDGPGQGAMLYERNFPLRPDWETVVAPVVDFALSLPQVDPQKIALSG